MSAANTRAILDAYLQGHDTSALAPGAIFTLMGSGQHYEGHEAIAGLLHYFYDTAFDATFAPTRLLVTEDGAALEGHLVGTHTGEFMGMQATGKQVRVPMCIVYAVGTTGIESAHIYFEQESLLAQLAQ